MHRFAPLVLVLSLLATGLGPRDAAAQFIQAQPSFTVPQSQEVAIIDAATNVLNEVMSIPARGIPSSLLRDAQGIVIVPSMLKGGFVIGIRRGRGVAVLRDDNGNWRAPSFITITGGSIGWQAGVQSTDLVLVFRTKRSIQGFTSGRFTIGADASAAAGPVGRSASAGTDASFRAEILSYSRSRGLFAGVALDGSVISLDNEATASFYRGTGLLPGDGPATSTPMLPAVASRLLQTIAMYAGAGSTPEVAAATTTLPVPATAVAATAPTGAANSNLLTNDLRAIQSQLAASSQKLTPLLDPSWRNFLTLPTEIYDPSKFAGAQQIDASLSRFDRVANDPKFHALTHRAEFQETLGLLKSYRDLQAAANPTIPLPAPPN